jgi:hypothetical protein
MARKLHVPKSSRPNKPEPLAVNRRTGPPGALYLMQLRSQAIKSLAPARGVRLDVNVEDNPETPEPVKIKKID